MRSAADVRDLRALIEQEGSTAHVVAKIEKAEAVDALDDVLVEADAVMVARGDLGVEIGPELVPLVQKRIIARALERGKPVITATQMLESMIHHPEPTRAEASDVANAVLDGTSAIMLSGETAMGEYPVQAVQTMDRIARAVEPSLGYRHQIPEVTDDPTIGNAMSNAACDLAEALGAKAMLVPTFTGTHGVGRGEAPPAAADRRADPQAVVGAPDGNRVGRDAELTASARTSRISGTVPWMRPSFGCGGGSSSPGKRSSSTTTTATATAMLPTTTAAPLPVPPPPPSSQLGTGQDVTASSSHGGGSKTTLKAIASRYIRHLTPRFLQAPKLKGSRDEGSSSRSSTWAKRRGAACLPMSRSCAHHQP